MNEQRRKELEGLGAFVLRMMTFLFGMQIVAYDLLFMRGEPTELRLAVLIVGGGLMVIVLGPVAAASFAQIIRAARGGSDE